MASNNDLGNKDTQLQEKVNELKNGVQALANVMDRTLTHLLKATHQINERFDKIEAQIEDLKGGSDQTIVSLENGFNELKVEIQKIGQVTGYDELLHNQSSLGLKN